MQLLAGGNRMLLYPRRGGAHRAADTAGGNCRSEEADSVPRADYVDQQTVRRYEQYCHKRRI